MKVGFTGTQRGMTERQVKKFLAFLSRGRLQITEFHHGDCIGADEESHILVAQVLGADKIYIHPPEDDKKRAYMKSPHVARVRPYLERNRVIVNATDVLIAAPKTMVRPTNLRGQGTWSTIIYAEKHGKKVIFLEP